MKYLAIAMFSLSSMLASSVLSADGSKVALGAYCPVAYVSAQKALYGDPKSSSEYEGKIYHLVNADAKKAFDAEPEKFVKSIKYDAYCATGVALGKKLVTEPNLFSAVGGKVYLFSSQGAKDAFDKDPKGMIQKAEANWNKLK